MARLVARRETEKHPLLTLYDSAGDLEVQLEGSLRDPAFLLTPGHIGAFNQILKEAREAVPDSKALNEDAAEIDENTRAAVAYHMLHTTIVPTLHNALPPDVYDKRG